jgi:hypothetical protein
MNILNVKTLFTAAGAALVLAACGSDGNKETVAIDDLFGQVESAECAVGVRCHLFSDEPFCKTWFEQVASTGGISPFAANVAAVKAGRSRYDDAAAAACVKAISQSPCGGLTTGLEGAGSICQKLFVGTIADGQSCAVDAECLAGSFCAVLTDSNATACAGTCTRGGTLCNDDSQCTGGKLCDRIAPNSTAHGTCVTPIPPGAVNQPCGTLDRCQAGLMCSLDASGAPVCKAYAKAGEACQPLGCVDGLLCASTIDRTSGTCVTPAAKGDPCELPGQCGGELTSIFCDLTQHRCVDALTSGPCSAGRAAVSECNFLTSFCDSSAANPVCTPIVAIGAPCHAGSIECGFTGATCMASAPGASTGTCMIETSCNP